MADRQLSREEALVLEGYSHACHALLFCDTKSTLFGKIPIRHILLMQMRFDGLLGFSGGFVNVAKESLEEGLSRELSEELGVDITISEEHHIDAHFAPTSPITSSSRLILHFYAKKIEEEEIRIVEKAASAAAEHGQEVLGMVRVPLYTLKDGSGLATFLSHSFVGNARSQLLKSLLHFNLVTQQELNDALSHAMKINAHTARDLQVAMTFSKAYGDLQ